MNILDPFDLIEEPTRQERAVTNGETHATYAAATVDPEPRFRTDDPDEVERRRALNARRQQRFREKTPRLAAVLFALLCEIENAEDRAGRRKLTADLDAIHIDSQRALAGAAQMVIDQLQASKLVAFTKQR